VRPEWTRARSPSEAVVLVSRRHLGRHGLLRNLVVWVIKRLVKLLLGETIVRTDFPVHRCRVGVHYVHELAGVVAGSLRLSEVRVLSLQSDLVLIVLQILEVSRDFLVPYHVLGIEAGSDLSLPLHAELHVVGLISIWGRFNPLSVLHSTGIGEQFVRFLFDPPQAVGASVELNTGALHIFEVAHRSPAVSFSWNSFWLVGV